MLHSKYLRLAALMRNERRTPAALAELQARKLRRLVAHAIEHVPFYRRLYRQAGVRSADIRSAADLAHLPLVNKSMLRAEGPDDLVDQRLKRSDLIERHTSGSSGTPFRFYADASFDQHCKAQYLRPYLVNGRGPFDHVLHFSSVPGKRPGWFDQMGLMRESRVGCSESIEGLIAAVTTAKADIVQGYPSVLSTLAPHLEPGRFRRPRLVFTDSELLTPDVRSRIEAAFGAPVYDVFGTFETDNIGYECREHAGFHLAIDCVVAEFIRNGVPAPPGESGQLVCTVLNNFAMPLIRYELGDIAAAAPRPCACGRPMPLMRAIEGRTVDCIQMPDGNLKSPMQFLIDFDSISDIVREYQVVQTAQDAFLARVVPAGDFGSEARGRIADIIGRQCPGARVRFELVAEIEREPSGKRRTFICQV